MKQRILFIARTFLIFSVSIIIILLVIIMLFEKQFIFFPSKYPSGQYDQAANMPGLSDRWITTKDGIKLHGWFLPADSAIATLVMCHGNAGNISGRYALMVLLRQQGFNVLMFDYRGYGRSEGEPSEEGIYEDGRAAFDYAAADPQVDPDRIILWGTSLGGAVAAEVATQRKAAGLILESTFTSAGDMAAVYYPSFIRFFLRTKLNTIDKIPQIKIPLLVMHGNRDGIVPFRFGKEIFAAASEPKEFYEIDGADHNDTYMVGKGEYFRCVREFAVKYKLVKVK